MIRPTPSIASGSQTARSGPFSLSATPLTTSVSQPSDDVLAICSREPSPARTPPSTDITTLALWVLVTATGSRRKSLPHPRSKFDHFQL